MSEPTVAREDYTIAGKTFSILQPYGEGHVLTAGEASALNQTFAENIRNNFAAKVKEAVEANTFDQEVFQGALDDYQEEYEFGVRRGGGGRTSDPLQAEALNIARDLVRQALVKKGIALKDVTGADVTRLAKDLISSGKYPEIMTAAQARVAAAQNVTAVELGELNLTPKAEAQAEAPVAEAEAPARAEGKHKAKA